MIAPSKAYFDAIPCLTEARQIVAAFESAMSEEPAHEARPGPFAVHGIPPNHWTQATEAPRC